MLKLLSKFSLLAESCLKYGVAAVMLTVPLYPKFPFLRLPGIQVAVRLEDFVVFLVFLLWLVAIAPKLKELLKSKIVVAILLFLGVGLASVLAGIFLTQTVVPHIGILHWARRVEYISLFFVGLSSVRKREDIYFYIKILFIIVAAVFLYGVGQKYFNVPVITTQNEEYSRGVALRYMPGAHLVSTFAGHYDMAAFLILVFPTLYLFLTSPSKTLRELVPDTKPLLTRGIILALCVMGLWLLVNTASRISLVSYLGSSVFALILMKRKKFIPILVIFTFIFASLSSNLVDRYMNILNVTLKNIVSAAVTEVYAQAEAPPAITPLEDRSTSIRLNVEWPRAIRALTKNPLTGTGYSSISLATDNDYLRMLGETGILGLASFGLVLGNISFKLLKKLPKSSSILPEDHFLVGMFATIPGIMVNMIFIDILEASKFAILFWLLFGLAISVARNKND